jgi:hypothetical protein
VEGKGEGRVYNSHGREVFSYSRGIMLSLPIYLTLIFFFGKAVGRRFPSVSVRYVRGTGGWKLGLF